MWLFPLPGFLTIEMSFALAIRVSDDERSGLCFISDTSQYVFNLTFRHKKSQLFIERSTFLQLM